MKIVKRREEKDLGGSKEEIVNDGNYCFEVSVVFSIIFFLLRVMFVFKFWN